MEHYLKQNNAIDIYENYFSGKRFSSIDSDPPSAKTISIFRYIHIPLSPSYYYYVCISHGQQRPRGDEEDSVPHILVSRRSPQTSSCLLLSGVPEVSARDVFRLLHMGTRYRLLRKSFCIFIIECEV